MEIFFAFLFLGVIAFGGPVAHLGYFHQAFVQRRGWLSEHDYADLLTLCQFLPGPASSQVGFAIGLYRGGLPGAIAAWMAFTLPSALMLLLFALSAASFGGQFGQSLIDGLKLVAVAIVAHAVWSMGRRLCPDRQRVGIALGALFIVTLLGGLFGQLLAIAAGAVAGVLLCRSQVELGEGRMAFVVGRWVSRLALGLFVLLLGILPLFALGDSLALVTADALFRAGALVFGGGHVVLPMLESAVVAPGWVSQSDFLTGYGVVQAVPGPLFSLASYLGAIIAPVGQAVPYALLALVMLFLPGFLLLLAVMPHWERLRRSVTAQTLMLGANAAVVGVLGAALYDPVWVGAISGPWEMAIALGGFLLLSVWRCPAWVVALGGALSGLILP
nr:chromate efflux transporter [Salinicola sp. S1-1-2]